MTDQLRVACAVLAAALVLASEALYLWTVFRPAPGRQPTRPSRSTFWVWTAVQGMLAWSYLEGGAGWSAAMSVAYAAGFAAIALVSTRFGWGRWSAWDTAGSAIAALAIAAYFSTNDAFWMLCLALVADAAGAIPTLAKSAEDPESESLAAWNMTVIAAALNAASVAQWSAADWLYQGEILAVNLSVAATIAIGRARLGRR